MRSSVRGPIEMRQLSAIPTAIEKHRVLRREQADLSEIRTRLNRLTPREGEVLNYAVNTTMIFTPRDLVSVLMGQMIPW